MPDDMPPWVAEELAQKETDKSTPKPLTAAYQVICRGRRSGEHSRLIAVVVGEESDAARVADQWNLAHLADIAAHADATFAVVVPAEVGVYLFERFAVVEHS
jgi:hypothetical protein